MYRSLVNSGCLFILYILALDDETEVILKKINQPNIHVFRLNEIESWLPRLREIKGGRSLIEYYFTLTPQLPLYLFDQKKEINVITYLDADLYFYASPEPIFSELGDKSILVTPHRYPERLLSHEKYGIFNVQYQTFRRDKAGLACLHRWSNQCLDWCYDRVEDEKYGDQKYLDEWPQLYADDLVILKHQGAGVAPWNWSTEQINLTKSTAAIGNHPLIFYHYHGVKILNPYFMSNGLLDWGVMPRHMVSWFYGGYLRELRNTRQWVNELTGILLPMRDRVIRGKGVGLSSLPEILRKAWAQATFSL